MYIERRSWATRPPRSNIENAPPPFGEKPKHFASKNTLHATTFPPSVGRHPTRSGDVTISICGGILSPGASVLTTLTLLRYQCHVLTNFTGLFSQYLLSTVPSNRARTMKRIIRLVKWIPTLSQCQSQQAAKYGGAVDRRTWGLSKLVGACLLKVSRLKNSDTIWRPLEMTRSNLRHPYLW